MTMLTYVEEKGLYVSEIGWTVVSFRCNSFVVVVVVFGPHEYLSYNAFKARFPSFKTDFLLYEGILTAIKSYKRRLGLDVKENFAIGDASVWKYLHKACV